MDFTAMWLVCVVAGSALGSLAARLLWYAVETLRELIYWRRHPEAFMPLFVPSHADVAPTRAEIAAGVA